MLRLAQSYLYNVADPCMRLASPILATLCYRWTSQNVRMNFSSHTVWGHISAFMPSGPLRKALQTTKQRIIRRNWTSNFDFIHHAARLRSLAGLFHEGGRILHAPLTRLNHLSQVTSIHVFGHRVSDHVFCRSPPQANIRTTQSSFSHEIVRVKLFWLPNEGVSLMDLS